MKKYISIIVVIVVFVSVLTGCIQRNSKEIFVDRNIDEVSTTQEIAKPSTEKNTEFYVTETMSTTKSENKNMTDISTTLKSTTTTQKQTTITTTNRVTTTQKQTTTKKPSTTHNATTTKPTTKATETKHTHSMPCGNVGKWYSSKEEFMSDYNAKVDYWNTKLENGDVSYEECASNVPRGYEVWQCSCGKWTGNYKYK